MSKLLSTLLFSLFLLFQTTSLAEEETTPTETNIEDQDGEASQEHDVIEEETQEEPKEEISEAQKEAEAAEAAELREVGEAPDVITH